MSDARSGSDAGEPDLVLERILDAPRELVWRAWTEPEHVSKWFSPEQFTNPVVEIDLRVGGALRVVMRGPDGVDYPMTGEYLEIVEPERIVMATAAVEGADGTPQLQVDQEVTLEDLGGRTKLTLRATVRKAGPDAAASRSGMEMGWQQTLDKLTAHLREMAAST